MFPKKVSKSFKDKAKRNGDKFTMKKFKNNKACGDDLVINEYIKSITEKFIELNRKLFNLIFQSGVIPDSWLYGNIKSHINL
jgi:hypothetical protein